MMICSLSRITRILSKDASPDENLNSHPGFLLLLASLLTMTGLSNYQKELESVLLSLPQLPELESQRLVENA